VVKEIAELCGSGGVRAVMAENLLVKHQLIVLRRARKRRSGSWRVQSADFHRQRVVSLLDSSRDDRQHQSGVANDAIISGSLLRVSVLI
jgi:hypothetical protein